MGNHLSSIEGAAWFKYPTKMAHYMAIAILMIPLLVYTAEGQYVNYNVCNKRCTVAWAPVCGSDGKTWRSACDIRDAACKEGKDVVVVHQGECASSCVDSRGCSYVRSQPQWMRSLTCMRSSSTRRSCPVTCRLRQCVGH